MFSALIDFAVFYLLCRLGSATGIKETVSIVISTAAARIISASVCFTLTKIWCFESRRKPFREIILFSILFVLKLAASAALVSALSFTDIPVIICKAIVDSFLFLISYLIQKFIIFR